MTDADMIPTELDVPAPEANGATAAGTEPKAKAVAPRKPKKAKKKPVELRPSEASKPTRVLPTTRIAFVKQLELLRAFAVAAGPSTRPVSLKEVADIIGIAQQTVSLGTPFYFDIGLIRKGEMGKAMPSDALRAFNIAHEWEAATASRKLAPVFIESWFWKAIQARLRYLRTMPEHEVLAAIQMACGASQQYKPQLLQLLAFLQAAGLIERDGATVRIGPTAIDGYQSSGSAPSPEPPEEDSGDGGDGGSDSDNLQPRRRTAIATSFAQGTGTSGALQFKVSVNVDMTEMRDWKPERISALFAGIAQVLAAKANVEQRGD